jgi:hypothetical protein
MRAVLVTIADAANTEGEHSRPGIDGMTSGSLYSESTVGRAVRKLLAGGWIEQTSKKGPGKVVEYRMLNPETGEGIFAPAHLFPVDEVVDGVVDAKGNTGQTTHEHRSNIGHSDDRCSDDETVCCNYVNGKDLAGAPARELVTSDPVKRHAHELTILAFEQPQKPVTRGGFPAVMARIEAEVRAGTSIQAIKAAIVAGDVTWTADGLRTAISRAKPSGSKRTRADGDERSMDELLQVAAAGDKGRTRRR